MKSLRKKIFASLLFLVLVMGTAFVTHAAQSVIIYGQKSATVELGASRTMNYTTNPRAARLTYSMKNTSIATVSNTGVITGRAAGRTILYVKAAKYGKYGAASIAVPITVTRRDQKITGTTYVNVTVNSTYQMKFNTVGTRHYSSSDPAVATVSQKGVVTGISAGTAYITLTADATRGYGSATRRIPVTVKRAGQRLKWGPTSITLTTGGQKKITASAKTPITYVSSNPEVAYVNSNGLVTAQKAGSATITITAIQTNKYNPVSAKIPVTVKKKVLSEEALLDRMSDKGMIDIWSYDDFDGDGDKEAFAVILRDNSARIDKVYYIDCQGKITVVCKNVHYWSYSTNSVFRATNNVIKCGGKGYFFADYGPIDDEYRTLVFGVKNDKPYELNISRKIEGIFKSNKDIAYTLTNKDGKVRILNYYADSQQFKLGRTVKLSAID